MNIEIGKQYVIKNHPYEPNNGLIVTVTGYYGKDVEPYVGYRWSIDQLIVTTLTVSNTPFGKADHVNQDILHPLDNNTGFEAGSWEALKDIFSPSDLVTS
jgi:hypothetical protein